MHGSIVPSVEPHELVDRLVTAEGGPMKVARKMGKPKLQPTLHKFCAGQVRTPKFPTAQAIARHFGLPVEALYDAKAATAAAAARFSDTAAQGAPALVAVVAAEEPMQRYGPATSPGIADAVHRLAAALLDAQPTTKKAVAVLLSALAESPQSSSLLGEQIAALLSSEKQQRGAA
jgi:hypothetical protein